MDLLTIAGALLRRWYVVLPLVVATAIAAVVVDDSIPSEFRASGSVLIVDPQLDPSSLPAPGDRLDEALTALQDPATLEELASGGASVFSGTIDEATVEVVAIAESATDAEQTVTNGLVFLQAEVERIEAADDRFSGAVLEPQLLTPTILAEPMDDGRFRAAGSVRLVDPDADNINPFPAGGSTMRLLEVAVTSDAGRARVAELSGPEIDYRVDAFYDPAPIMSFEVTAEDPAAVLQGFDAIKQVAASELDQRQARAGVPTLRRHTLETIAQPQTVTDESPPLNRVVALVIVLGFSAAIGLGLAFESVAQRLRRSRIADSDDEAEEVAERAAWSSAVLSENGAASSPDDGIGAPPGGSLSQGRSSIGSPESED